MRLAVHVWSRKQVVALDPAPDPHAALISIYTPGRERLPKEVLVRWRRGLFLAFGDVTPEGLAHEPEGSPHAVLFNWEQARLIIDFAEQNLHCDWHVHCDAGKSRSVGVGCYLANRYQRELKIHSTPSDEFRNLHVIRVLREAAGEERTSWPK